MNLVLISALQHYEFCPRQCALIHIEQEFSDNLFTQRGNAVHRLVDDPVGSIEKGIHVERALPLYSRKLGLVGKADLVEWHGKVPYPVEYKHGPRKSRKADEIQLAAQAMCLEEMTGVQVNEGALYHHKSRRRRVISITVSLREEVINVISAVRALYDRETLPFPVNDNRCDDCSLYDICQPKAVAGEKEVKNIVKMLFTIENDNL